MTDLYTVAEAAKALGIAERTVRLYCQQGRLHADKLGRDWAIYDLEVR